MQLFLDLLRTGPKTQYIFGTAFRTQLHGRLGEAAVMADQRPVSVLGQRNVTMGTFHHMPAHPAGYKTGVTPTVQKEHALLSPSQPVLQKFLQPFGKNGTVAVFKLLP